jgi:hypothetical protein
VNELKNEINSMSKEMGEINGKLLDLAKHQSKEQKGNEKRIEGLGKGMVVEREKVTHLDSKDWR